MMSSSLLDLLRWMLWLIVIAIAATFFTALAHAGASFEARRKSPLVWKLLNLSVLPVFILLFTTLLKADIRRVYYPPATPRWISWCPAFQLTTVVSLDDYFVPIVVYLLSVGMLLWKLRRMRPEEG